MFRIDRPPTRSTLQHHERDQQEHAAAPSPTASPHRGGRSPNCHARTTRPPICAQNTAASTNARSCTTVSAISTPAGCASSVIFTPSSSARAGPRSARPPPPAPARRSAPPAPSTATSPCRASAPGRLAGLSRGSAAGASSRGLRPPGAPDRDLRGGPSPGKDLRRGRRAWIKAECSSSTLRRPSARSRTGRRNTPSSRRRDRQHGHSHAGMRRQPGGQRHAQRKQHDQKPRQRHQRLRRHRIGQRQRERGDRIRPVGERQHAQPRPRAAPRRRAGTPAASGCGPRR